MIVELMLVSNFRAWTMERQRHVLLLALLTIAS